MIKREVAKLLLAVFVYTNLSPAYGVQQSHSTTRKRGGLFGLGKSSRKIEETRDLVEPTQIITDHFESLGTGSCKMTQHSSGFFAPKIKGDPFISAIRSARSVITFGDAIPTAANVIGAGAQTLTHALQLANLAQSPNPMTRISQIFLSRFVTGPVFSNTKTLTTRKESRPIQSRVEVGLLRINNERTHLEGIWHVNKGSIETGKFTTEAPKHEVSQTSKSHGFSLSLNPAAVLGACMNPLMALPNVAVQESETSFDRTDHANMIMEVGDLFVRCNDAVFRGSTIRARMIEMLVTGELTIETLTNTFRSDVHSAQVAGSLASIAGMIHGVKTDRAVIDPRLGVVPVIRIADEEELRTTINQVSQLVGVEKFYLKVGELLYNKGGMISDGVVAGKRIDERVSEHAERHRRVINPSVGELVAMLGQVDELQEVQQRYMTKRIIEGTPAEIAKKEAEGITKEVVKKAKDLKKERILKRHKVMEQIEAKLPKVDGELAEVRGKILTEYLEEHKAEIIAEAERYTLEELRAEAEFYGTPAQKGFHETLLNCIKESDITEQELELHTAQGIGEALNAGAETFNNLMIPGYAAWADGGTTTEVINSATSDIVLTLIGGKMAKIAWQGTKALYQGAKSFGKELKALTVMERPTITWGMWNDLPKVVYKGRTYAKIGERYYSKHAVDYMIPKNMKKELGIPVSQEVRGIPSTVVENAIRYGKKIDTRKGQELRHLHQFENVTVVTDESDTIVISLGERT